MLSDARAVAPPPEENGSGGPDRRDRTIVPCATLIADLILAFWCGHRHCPLGRARSPDGRGCPPTASSLPSYAPTGQGSRPSDLQQQLNAQPLHVGCAGVTHHDYHCCPRARLEKDMHYAGCLIDSDAPKFGASDFLPNFLNDLR